MQLGMPTLIETKDIEQCAALCKELKLDFIELNMNLPEYQTDVIDTAKLKHISEEYKIYFTVHFDENLNVCDFNKNVANAYLDTVMRTIDIAKALNIPVLNMHMSEGVHFKMPDKKVYLFNEYIEIYTDKLRHFRQLCENRIGDTNIKICIENTAWSKHDFIISGIEELLKSEVFALTFDIGHNKTNSGGADEAVILKHENRLHHMHIHDATEKNCHLALGTGELDLHKYFALGEKNNCRVVLETKNITGLKQSVEWVRSNIKSI